MKSNESQTTVENENNASVDKRGNYKGIPYAILYQAPRGYFARILDKSLSKKILSLRYFDDRDEAEEHLELEVDGYLQDLKDKAKKKNSKTVLEKFKYKGLDCVMRTVAYPATKLQPQERYSHVAICDELGIRTKSHDTHTAAMQELKKLVDESIKDRDNKKGNSMTKNNASVDKRGKYKGIPYAILYQPPRGYFARILDKSFSKILSLRYFDDRDEAEAHLQREVDGYMRNLKDKAKKENSMTKNNAKKIAILKSNAAPEVKLKAIQKLDNAAKVSPQQAKSLERQIKAMCRDISSQASHMVKQEFYDDLKQIERALLKIWNVHGAP